jgi:hypothetical protein
MQVRNKLIVRITRIAPSLLRSHRSILHNKEVLKNY